MRNILVFISLSLLMYGCISPPTITPYHPTETRLPQPSATINWFPETPTKTSTPVKILIPLEITPTLPANLLLFDDFSNLQDWSGSDFLSGTVALGKNEITLVITEPQGYLASIREDTVFEEYFLEIKAQPSICKEFDEYGILINYSSNVTFYRFSLSCNGSIRLDKLLDSAASSPQPWIYHASVPNGAPSSSIIGVSVTGDEQTFFVNNEIVFSHQNNALPIGGIGVFARSGGDNAVTVSFSDLSIYSIGQ